jgi:hypothetical protein
MMQAKTNRKNPGRCLPVAPVVTERLPGDHVPEARQATSMLARVR